MKVMKFLPIILLVALVVPGTTTMVADEGHMHAATNHCDTPTEEITINAQLGVIAYEETEYFVNKNTCYMLKFYNPNPNVEHDVNIDAVEVDGVTFMMVHIHVANNTDGTDGVKGMHIMTPDADTRLTIYCSVSGHRAQGMEAELVVGDGSSGIPFNGLYAVLGLFIIARIVPRLRKNVTNEV